MARVLDLPTGVGKTTCIDVALFALALDAGIVDEQRWCPRRIAMVVDRRIVADQVAERGRKLLRALMTSDEAIVVEVAKRLRLLDPYRAKSPSASSRCAAACPRTTAGRARPISRW
ncbi:MAG: hypothetical protein IPK20_16330 [Betaproteobacteria bacterium]|nr:hypothetical protein [Betaproteobacteria bacterium]